MQSNEFLACNVGTPVVDSTFWATLVLLSMAVSMILAFTNAHNLVTGVRNAVNQLQNIGRGYFDEEIPMIVNRGEITTLLESIKKTQQQLKNSYSQLTAERLFSESLTSSMDDGVYALDQAGSLVFINQAAERLLGWREDELVNYKFHDLIHVRQVDGDEPLNGEGYPALTSASRGESYYSDKDWFKHRDGELIPVELSIAPLKSGDEIVGSVAVFRDITERIQLDRKLRQALEDVRQSSRSKDEFLASMSHELRTPLTSIIGNAEFLIEKLSTSALKEVVRDIETAGQAQLALVNDILDMSKIESGKFSIEERPYDLDRLLRDIGAMLSIRAQDAGLQLIIDQQNRETHELVGDSNRIGQILINLLGNAIKFTEEGEVRLTTSVNGKWLQFVVKDTGIGMTKEEQSKLFQKFEQADRSISRRFGGSGLGLYISFNLVQMMGGEISAVSMKGAGSTFTLKLPYMKSETQVAATAQKSNSPALNRKFKGNVLVVEDTPALQMLLRRILEAMGVRVTTADNGQKAVDLITDHAYDLILMDMQMPVMDGIEATRVLRMRGVSTPVYALTANVMVKHREQFEEAGCDGFLGKPIDKESLRNVLSQHLDESMERGQTQNALPLELIEWNDQNSVGYPRFDQEHQQIVVIINQLVRYCLRDETGPTRDQLLVQLAGLQELMLDHLKAEERLLRRSGYPELESHIERHEEYWDRLLRLYGEQLDDNQIEALTRVMLSWWHHHIQEEDLAYKDHLVKWMDTTLGQT